MFMCMETFKREQMKTIRKENNLELFYATSNEPIGGGDRKFFKAGTRRAQPGASAT